MAILTLALALPSDTIGVGSLKWQPVFAGSIFLVAGINALLLGFASRLYTTTRGLTNEDALLRFYRRHLGFEAFIIIGIVVGLVGLALDVMLLGIDAGGVSRLGVAAVAQALIISAANLIFVGAMCGLLDE
jgi:hypothetical protein